MSYLYRIICKRLQQPHIPRAEKESHHLVSQPMFLYTLLQLYIVYLSIIKILTTLCNNGQSEISKT